MRYRYLIERAYTGTDLYCSTIDASDEARQVGTLGTFDNAADAKLAAEAEAGLIGEVLRWKAPPKGWEPDALYVSQFLDDGVSESADS